MSMLKKLSALFRGTAHDAAQGVVDPALLQPLQRRRGIEQRLGGGEGLRRDRDQRMFGAEFAERLVERLQNRLELRTQVGGVNSPLCRQLLSERHHFFGGRLEGAGVGKSRTQS